MMMKKQVHNKLVRDHIPQLLSSKNIPYKARVLGDEDYAYALRRKLAEEMGELFQASDDEAFVEEVADLFEVLNAMLALRHKTLNDVEAVRTAKLRNRGGFFNRIFLEATCSS